MATSLGTHPEGPGKGPDSGFDGWMEQVALPEMIQFLCLEGRNRVLMVRNGDLEGRIYFSQGQVVHASSPGGSGADAFFEIMSWRSGSFQLVESEPPSTSIDVPWNFLVMEALRRMDEGTGSALPAASRHEATRVLVVDDSPLFCKAFRKRLEDMGEEMIVREAGNGKEALEIIGREDPDLVTLDINMPVMAGDLTLKHIMIRSPAPVLILSGFSEETFPVVMDFMRLGAVDFIPKPTGEAAWEEACLRIKTVMKSAREFQVKKIRRARAMRPAGRKVSPGPPARNLVIVIGGAGGLLEIQKLLPRIRKWAGRSALVVQDVIPSLVPFLSGYMNTFCEGVVAPLGSEGLLAQGRCLVASGTGGLLIRGTGEGPVVAETGDEDGGPFEALLSTASDIFRGGLTVLLISGARVALEGVDQVKERGGRVYVQDPDTCLHGAPLRMLLDAGLADGIFDPESVDMVLQEGGPPEAELGAEILGGLGLENLIK